jgi:hypothetical protein
MEEAASASGIGHREHAGPATLFGGKYLSITSYRRDGTPVATPVWFVQEDGDLLVQTDAGSGKVKRIRRNPNVRIAPCTASGRLRAELTAAHAAVLPADQTSWAEELLAHKYRMGILVIRPLWAVKQALHLGRPRTTTVILKITPG